MKRLPMIPILLLGSITSCQQQGAASPSPAQEFYTRAAQRSIAQVRPLFESQEFVIRYQAGINQPTRELTVPAKAQPKLRKLLLAALESGECTASPCDKPKYLCITLGPQAYDGSHLSITATKTAGAPVLLNTTLPLKEQIFEYLN